MHVFVRFSHNISSFRTMSIDTAEHEWRINQNGSARSDICAAYSATWAMADGRNKKAFLSARGETMPRSLCRSEEHTSELQSRGHLVCRLLLEKKKQNAKKTTQEGV